MRGLSCLLAYYQTIHSLYFDLPLVDILKMLFTVIAIYKQ